MKRDASDRTAKTATTRKRQVEASRRPPRPGAEDGMRALRDHAVERAAAARERYGPVIDWSTFLELLEDPAVTRFPTTVEFDAAPLERGEFAHVEPAGDTPSQGFRLFVHPRLREREDVLPLAAAYHVVRVNYGDVATRVEAELFGATLLGLDVDRYYESLVSLSDELAEEEDRP